jgi:ABC-type multidrug transport system ATPase subunit
MDEADRLCDRIAIVDHGELKALDTPLKLKASIPGKNVIDVSFQGAPADWLQQLERLPAVERVTGQDNIFRISSGQRPRDDDRAHGHRRSRQGAGAVAVGPEHDAR